MSQKRTLQSHRFGVTNLAPKYSEPSMRREKASPCLVSRLPHNPALFRKIPSSHPHFHLRFYNPKPLFKDVIENLDI